MRKCPKCGTEGKPGTRICRRCGGILVEVPEAPAEAGPSAAWECAKCGEHHGRGRAVCWKCGTDWKGVEDPGFAPEEGPPAPEAVVPPPEAVGQRPAGSGRAPEAVMRRPWTCRKCGERHGSRETICWKCGTDSQGTEDPAFIPADAPGGSRPESRGVEPPRPSDDPGGSDRAVASTCARCGSGRIVPVEIEDQNDTVFSGPIRAVVRGNPEAILLRETLREDVWGCACADCGYLELRVRNPEALYERYLRSRARRGE